MTKRRFGSYGFIGDQILHCKSREAGLSIDLQDRKALTGHRHMRQVGGSLPISRIPDAPRDSGVFPKENVPCLVHWHRRAGNGTQPTDDFQEKSARTGHHSQLLSFKHEPPR